MTLKESNTAVSWRVVGYLCDDAHGYWVKIGTTWRCWHSAILNAITDYGVVQHKERIVKMIKRLFILVLLATAALLMACAPKADEATSLAENGRLVTVFRAPT